ncbi:DedA family protein [Terrabacter sp. 2YAF2]|uniref:DedA family protein n=1 Tax=Terrabacter sp. 2YAF2 TaxID=3233026 RepID=UPI003F97A375
MVGAGVLVAAGAMQLPMWLSFVAITVAAVAGDHVAYWLGRRPGPRLGHGPAPRVIRFLLHNLVGAMGWAAVMFCGGYWFGTIPFVSRNLELFLLGLMAASALPGATAAARRWASRRSAARHHGKPWVPAAHRAAPH